MYLFHCSLNKVEELVGKMLGNNLITKQTSTTGVKVTKVSRLFSPVMLINNNVVDSGFHCFYYTSKTCQG